MQEVEIMAYKPFKHVCVRVGCQLWNGSYLVTQVCTKHLNGWFTQLNMIQQLVVSTYYVPGKVPGTVRITEMMRQVPKY